MCTFSPEQAFSQNWGDCTNLASQFLCSISQFIREEGEGSTYFKKLYLYIQFKSTLAPDYTTVKYLRLPVGKFQCRQTGTNFNAKYRFQANWACGHPTFTNPDYSFRQDFVSYLPCFLNTDDLGCNQSVASINFQSLDNINIFNAPSEFGYLTRDSRLLEDQSIMNGTINIKLKDALSAYNIKTLFGYQIAISISPQTNIKIDSTFCQIQSGAGNWDIIFYRQKLICIQNNSVLFIDNFSDLYDYLRLQIKLQNQAKGYQYININVYLFQYHVDPNNFIIDGLFQIQKQEPIYFIRTTIGSQQIGIFSLYDDYPYYSTNNIYFMTYMSVAANTVTFDLNLFGQNFSSSEPQYQTTFNCVLQFEGFDFQISNGLSAQFTNAVNCTLSIDQLLGVQTLQINFQIVYPSLCAQQVSGLYSSGKTTLILQIGNIDPKNLTRKRSINSFLFIYRIDQCYSTSCSNLYSNLYHKTTFYSAANTTNQLPYGLIGNVQIKPLTNSQNTANELEIILSSLNYNIDRTHNTILVIEPTNRQNSNNPPPIYPPIDSKLYYSQDPIDCKCYYYDASSNEFEYTKYMCIRVIESASYYFSIHIYIYDQQTPNEQNISSFHCFIPEYMNSNSQDTFIIKLIEPGQYDQLYLNSTISYQAMAYQFQSISFSPLAAQTPSFKVSPPNFFSALSTYVTNSLVDQYNIDIITTQIFHNPYIYLRHSQLGPVIDSTLCTQTGSYITNKPSSIRAYTTQSYVIVCQSSLTNQNEFILQSQTEKTSASIPYEYFQNTTQPYNFYIINSQTSTTDQVLGALTKQASAVQLYNPANMIVQVYNLVDTVGYGTLKLHSMKFELNQGFTQFDRRFNSKIVITNNPSANFGSHCYAQSMESTYPENSVSGSYPTSLKVHICRVSQDQKNVIVEDENYQDIYQQPFQGYQFSNNRKFYIYFSVNIPQNQSPITYIMRYFTKYNINGSDYSYESARGQSTVNYQNCFICCITQGYHRTFSFNVKRFFSNQQVYRYFLSQDPTTMSSFIYDWNQNWVLNNTQTIPYDYIPIIRVYGVNGCSRNYRERYYNPQKAGNTYLLWQSDFFELGNDNYEYQEYYIKLTDPVNFGIPKIPANLQVPFSSMIVQGRVLYGSIFNTIIFFDQNKHYYDTSTSQQSQELKLNTLYYTNTVAGQRTSVFFRFLTTINQASTPNPSYPATYFEFIFPQLQVSNFVTDQYGIMNCQVFVNDILVNNIPPRNLLPRCRIFKVEYQKMLVTVLRVEDVNFSSIMNSVSFAFDITLPNPTYQYLGIDVIFDLYLALQTSPTSSNYASNQYNYQKFHLRIQEMILIDNINLPQTTAPAPIAISQTISDTTIGQIGVSNIWGLTWNQTTVGYDKDNSPGQKVEVRFQNGGIVQAQNNQVDSLLVYFNNVLQSPMWFSRLDQVLFYSAPNLPAGQPLKITIKGNNLWANQKYYYQPSLNQSVPTPSIQLIAYTGFPATMDGNMPRQNYIYTLNEQPFSSYTFRNLEFSLIQIQGDQSTDAQLVNGQRVTLIIQLQNNLQLTDIQTRKVWQIQIQFTAGVTFIERCFFKTPNNNVADIYQTCQVVNSGGIFSVNYRGQLFYNTNYVNYIVYVQAIINAGTIQYTINEITQAPFLNKIADTDYPIEGQLPNQSFIMTTYQSSSNLIKLDFIQGKHFPLYYEIYQVRQFANRQNTISKLRFRLKLPLAVQQGASNFVQITIPSSILPTSAYKPIDPTNELYCVFYEEMQPLVFYDVNKLSICTYTGGILTFQIPDTQLVQTYYIVEIKERYSPKYFTMPTMFTFNEFQLQLSSQSTSQQFYDSSYQSCPQMFATFNIYHFTTTQNNYDMLRLNFVPQTTLLQTNLLTATRYESFLLVELESQYFSADIGLLNPSGVYQNDNLPPFYNGKSLSCILRVTLASSTQEYDCTITVMFGSQVPTSIEQSRIQFVLSDFSNFNQFTAGITYDLYIPMIQMPNIPFTSIQVKLSFMQVQNQQYITQETSYWINYAYVQADTSTTTPFKVSLTNNNVQQTSSIFNFNFDTNMNINQSSNNLLLKWNNNFFGISGNDIKNLGSSNCKYIMFKNLNLLFVTDYPNPIPQIITPPSPMVPAFCNINSFNTLNYVQPYGFSFVYINSIANAQTIYTATTSSLSQNLDPLNDNTATLVWVSGFVSQFSVSRFVLNLTTPKQVPQGSQILINLQTNFAQFEEKCTILSGLTPIGTISSNIQFNQGSLECQRSSQKQYTVSGFSAITIQVNVQIELFIQTTSSASVQPQISATIFAQYLGQFYPIINYNQIKSSKTHVGLGMQQLVLLDKITIFSYSNDWLRMSYLINTRNMQLPRNQSKKITFQLPPLANAYDLWQDPTAILYSKYIHSSTYEYQLNVRNFMEAQSSVQPASPSKNFVSQLNYIPNLFPNIQNFYDINANQDTIMIIDSNTVSPLITHPTLNYQIDRKAVFIPQPNYYVFHLITFDNVSLYEEKYYEVFTKPREDLDDTFRVTPLTAEAGTRTTLILQFTLNVAAVNQDEIWIVFLTYDGLFNVFPIDLGLKYDQNNQIQCSYTITNTYQDPNSSQNCLIQLGTANQIQSPVVVRIPLPNGALINSQITIIIPYVMNPNTVGQTAGLKVQLRNKCSDHGPLLCIKYHAEDSYFILSPSSVTQGTCAFTSISKTVSQVPDYTLTPPAPQHIITTPTTVATSLPIGAYVTIIYPKNHVQDNPVCTFQQGICIYYTSYNMVLLKILNNPFSLSNPFNVFGLQNGIYRWTTATQSIMNVVIYQNSKINLSYQCNMNEYDYYQPIIPSSSPSICGTFTNTQTINPSYFLREGYTNTAKLYVYGMYYNRHVNIYRIQKPITVQSFVPGYCTASFQITDISTTPPTVSNIPYDCDVYTEFIIVTKLDSIQYNEAKYNFKGAYLTVFLMFIIDQSLPTTDIPTQIVVYSCFNNCFDLSNQLNLFDFMHVGKCLIDWVISYLPQPNLATAGFYTLPYYLRQAKINQQVEFQMLIRPRTVPADYVIDTFIFTIPNDFLIPPIQLFDSCSILGTINLSIQSCTLQRRNGSNRLTLIPSTVYDNSVKIMRLSNLNTKMLFTAPPYPGQYYLMGLEMYSNGQLVETQYMNITQVIGTTFYQPQVLSFFNIINPLNQLQKEIFHFVFTLNDQVLPIGYLRENSTSTNNIFSNIVIYFEFIGGGWNIHQGYLFDLGTGLPDGAKLGCSSKELQVLSGNQLTCILNHGTSPENMPNIVISGYEAFSKLLTPINIYITNLQSLSQGQLMTIKVGIQTLYPNNGCSGFLYILNAFIPQATISTTALTPESIGITVSTNPVVYSTTSYTFAITISSSYPGNPKIITNDLIGLKFPKNFIGKYQPILNNDVNTFIFPESDSIYIRVLVPNPLITLTFTLNNINNPDFQMLTPGGYSIDGVILDQNHQIKYKMTGKLPNTFIIQPFSNIPFIKVEAINSISGGDTNVTYKFTFITGHYIPPNGSISFFFPEGAYQNVKSMWTGCDLSGGDFDNISNQSFCTVQIGNRLDIILVNTLLSQIQQYSVVIYGITNPNIQNIILYNFMMQTFYSNQPSLQQVIGSASFKMPFLLYLQPFTCNLSVNSQYRQISVYSIYKFTFICDGVVRFNSNLWINLPYQYGIQENLGQKQCSSLDSNTLYKQSCSISNVNGQIILNVQLKQILIKTEFSILITLMNPSTVNSLYMFTAAFYKDSFQFAYTFNQVTLKNIYVKIISDSNVIQAQTYQANTQITLQNYPLSSGELATYIFKIPQIQLSKNVQLTEIFFPNSFSSKIGNNLECSLLQSSNLSFYFDMQTLLYMRTNTTSTQTPIPNYYQIQCSINLNYILEIQGLNQYLQDQTFRYYYILIRNIFNPGDNSQTNFKIIHSTQGDIIWAFNGNLNYKIMNSPNILDVVQVSAINKSLKDLSVYTFQLNLRSKARLLQNQIDIDEDEEYLDELENLSNQRILNNGVYNFGIQIQIPDQYDVFQQRNQISCYQTNQDSKTSSCQIFKEYIFIKDTRLAINSLSSQFSIQYLTNPQIPNPCSVSSQIKNKYFQFKIIDLAQNTVVHSSKQEDQSVCLQFVKNKFDISFSGPSNLLRGLVYVFNVTIEMPANSISLEPFVEDKNIIFNPTLITFENFDQQTTKQLQVQVLYGALLGNHTIQFNKIEYTRISSTQISKNSKDLYISPPLIQIFVLNLNPRKQMAPTIIIDDFIEYGFTYSEFLVTAKVTKQTSEQFMFGVQFDQAFKGVISINPDSILIDQNAQRFNFTITYLAKVITNPIALNFTLSSYQQQLIYSVTPPYKYLVFTISKIHKSLNIVRLLFQNNLPDPNLYSSDLGKLIYNPYVNDPQLLPVNQKILLPEILNVIQTDISNYDTTLKIVASTSSYIYYILTLQNSQKPQPQVIRDGIYLKNSQLAYSVVMTNRNAGNNIDYTANITLSGLKPDYSYSVFLVCENAFGLSQQVYQYNFQTMKAQLGAVIRFTLSSQVQQSTLIEQLAQVLRVQSNQIQILTSQDIIDAQISRNKFITYDIVVAPNTQTILKMYNYIASYIDNSDLFNQMMSNFLSQIVLLQDYPINYYSYDVQGPKFAGNPIIDTIGFYNAVILVEMFDKSYVYAQVVEKSVNKYNVQINGIGSNSQVYSTIDYILEPLISQQIILGIDQQNNQINQNWQVQVLTDPKTNIATIKLDDLKDGANYDIYITATNIMAYNDQSLFKKLPDSQIKKISFTTLFNYNTDYCQMLRDAYKVNQTLALAMLRQIQRNPNEQVCIKIFVNDTRTTN
ncbi:hypothetical protein ABPG72_000790 [Tetrahymena utriculariae]